MAQRLPHDPEGLARFAEIASKLEGLLKAFWEAPAAPRRGHAIIPSTPGVYLFTDNGKPVYVGQTRKLRDRLRGHTIPSASQESASFAFLVALKEARLAGLDMRGTRKAIATHAQFADLFRRAKERVADMEVRFIEVAEPDLRTVFEVYASLVLRTGEFNSFETH